MKCGSILHRANSWSRIKITVQMFKALCTFDQITPSFLNLVFGFCKRTSSSDENYMTCYCKISTMLDEKAEVKNKSRNESDDQVKKKNPCWEFFG